MTGVERIAAERRRQIEKEGWSAEHDDEEHSPGDLAAAALNYVAEVVETLTETQQFAIDDTWPWDVKWWKPGKPRESEADAVHCLEKAGALIAAEIDRRERQENSVSATPEPGEKP